MRKPDLPMITLAALAAVALLQPAPSRAAPQSGAGAARANVGATSSAGATTGTARKTSSLTASECRDLGGTVVTVTDNRCEGSHQYCHMPDTNARCIDKKD